MEVDDDFSSAMGSETLARSRSNTPGLRRCLKNSNGRLASRDFDNRRYLKWSVVLPKKSLILERNALADDIMYRGN